MSLIAASLLEITKANAAIRRKVKRIYVPLYSIRDGPVNIVGGGGGWKNDF